MAQAGVKGPKPLPLECDSRWK